MPVTTTLTTQERKSQHAVRHPQKEPVVEEHVWCGWRLAVHKGRFMREPPHLELALEPAAACDECVWYLNVVLGQVCFQPLFPQWHLS